MEKRRGAMKLIFSLVSLCGGLMSFAALAQPDAARLETMRLAEVSGGMELVFDLSATVPWTIREDSGERLVVRFRGALPGPALEDLQRGEGLIAAIEITAVRRTPPETRITVRGRQPLRYRAEENADGGLTFLLEARPMPRSEKEEPATATPPTVAPPPRSSRPTSPPRIVSPSRPSSSAAGEYRIGAGDVLAVDVFGLEELDRRVRVARDGQISLPLLGAFPVAGLTLQEAEAEIAAMLSSKRLVQDPQVGLFVEELVSRGISVQGAVVEPGIYQLLGEKTLLEVVGEAGGVREDAGRQIFVLRGGEERLVIDGEALIDRGDLSLDLPLAPGDIVMIPYAKELRVYVTGAVEKPGPVRYSSSEGITVLQAITAAGGPTERANLKNVHVIRRHGDEAQQKIKVNLKKIRDGKAEDLVLERGDTVVVGEWFL